MKNKKMSYSVVERELKRVEKKHKAVTFAFLGILVIVVVVIWWSSVREIGIFTIYKEDCKNITQVQFKCSDGTYYIDTLGCFDNLYFFFTKEGIECIDDSREIETCGRIEVEEIEIIDKSNQIYKECVETFTELRDRYSKYTSKPTEEFVKEDCSKYGYKKIKKSEITKEWLDENCNCMEICVDLECSNRVNCEFYKCGEYTIK